MTALMEQHEAWKPRHERLRGPAPKKPIHLPPRPDSALPKPQEVLARVEGKRDWMLLTDEAKEVYRESHPAPPPFRAESIIASVSRKHGFSVADMKSPRRERGLVRARNEAAWELKRQTTLSLPQIGKKLGNRDHTTIIYAISRHQALVDAGQA